MLSESGGMVVIHGIIPSKHFRGEIMEWEPIVAVSQIATGLATLIVAIVLAGQLSLQRKALNRAHTDAQREMAFSVRGAINSLILARLTNDSLSSAITKGFQDMNSLTEYEQLNRYVAYMRLVFRAHITEWRVGGADLDIDEFKDRVAQGLMATVGARQYYLQLGRNLIVNHQLQRSEELTRIFDEVYEELEGTPVPK